MVSRRQKINMPSLADRKKEYENYLSAVNEHNVEKALSFYEENMETKFNGVTVVKGKDQLQASYEKRIVNPSYSVYLIEYLPCS
jgi:hypothetical protein